MTRRIVVCGLVGMLALVAVGMTSEPAAARTRPLINVVDVPTAAPPGATMQSIRLAIMRGGARRRWVIRPVSLGRLRGTLHLRSHVAVVDIFHDTKTFSIIYVSSVNLLYRKEGDVAYIHRNYNSWIRNLENDIRIAISLIR